MPPPRTTNAPSPPEVLRLVGHPLRWRLLAELAASDRTVHELTDRVGEAQNLVSYHLGKLRAAGLVRSHRSAADRRDAYYRADLARLGDELAATAGALHPGLRPPAPRPEPRADADPVRVCFLCTGNSARSQMAEALANHRGGGAVAAVSAGSHPKALHPDAVRVMRTDHGIDIGAHTAKHLDVFADQRFDWVITLCDRVREVCPEFPGGPRSAHWSVPDPATEADADARLAAFRRTAADLDTRITFLLAALDDHTPAP